MGEDRIGADVEKYDLAVIGLGYVGLPLAVVATQAGLGVLGFDTDADTIANLSSGRSHISDVSDRQIEDLVGSGLTLTSEPAPLANATAIVICVPTPLTDREPDLSAVMAAGRTAAAGLRPGMLVVLESTTYPGTTEEVLQPILEELSGLRGGADFFLAYSPERIDPGNERWNLTNTPKIVGGIDDASSERAAELYSTFCNDVVVASGTREAELAKLLENTYRHVNIALVNELAVFTRELGVDLWEAIRLAATKPFGFQPFYPGPGVGGHCIPIDPSYLSHRVKKLGRNFRFVELAGEINDQMPAYVVQRAIEALNQDRKPVNGSTILILGVAYKADVADIRVSPSIPIVRRLREFGADLSYWDPHVATFEVDGIETPRIIDVVAAAADADLVLLLTAHSELDVEAVAAVANAMLDTRGVTRPGTATRL